MNAMAEQAGSDLPSGVLAFAFTDIEGSSESWTRRPGSMAQALEIHNTLMRRLVAEHGGIELKNLGDGFCFVFTGATDAMAFAVAAQRALQDADWPDDEQLKVRIGIHTGEATPTRQDYFGETINRAARVMDAANGDQIMISAATNAIVDATNASSRWTIESCGEFDLKGIGATELLRLTTPDLAVDERAVRAKPVGVQRLPQNLQTFVGREDELDDLATHVGDNRLITLVGVGGLGKSRLAIELGRRIAENYSDGVYWCPLAPVSDPEDVVAAINSVVGVTPRPGLTLTESLAQALDGQKALLIIDNCEHVSDTVSALVSELLERTIGPSIIATSRRPLQVATQLTWQLEPLRAASDQVQLFVDRVREQSPTFDPDLDDRDIIRRICDALDGLPLAIELAAARARIMTPTAILDRLDDRFALLGARRDTNERLRDIVRWSYEQLNATEAQLLRSLSIFAGGFQLDAVMAVCSSEQMDELDLLDALQTLVDDALIRRIGSHSDRFFMLETLRQFGTEELATLGEADQVTEAFLTWITSDSQASASLINTPREFAGFDALDRERDNIREAFTVLTSNRRFEEAADLIGPLYFYSSLTVQFEVCGWASELVGVQTLTEHPWFGDLCATASYGSYGQADTATALAFAEKGLAADPTNGPSWILATMSSIAQAELVRLAELFAELLPRLDEQPPEVRFWINAWRALIDAWITGEGEAEQWALAAERAAHECAGTSALAGASWVLGVATTNSDVDVAVAHFRRALELLGERAHRHLVAQTAQDGLMALLSQNGDIDEAVDACRDNLESVVRNDWIAVVFEILPPVTVCIRAGLPDLAAQLVGCAEANGVHIRGRTYKALAQLDEQLVADGKARGAALSLRQMFGSVVAGLALSRTAIDLID